MEHDEDQHALNDNFEQLAQLEKEFEDVDLEIRMSSPSPNLPKSSIF